MFLAARRDGPTGGAIGIDLTEERIAPARRDAEKARPANVEFYEATIDGPSLPDDSADRVTSDRPVNLAPDKPAVFR